jgi:hypothetical protein
VTINAIAYKADSGLNFYEGTRREEWRHVPGGELTSTFPPLSVTGWTTSFALYLSLRFATGFHKPRLRRILTKQPPLHS